MQTVKETVLSILYLSVLQQNGYY